MRVAELKESYPPSREAVEELANVKPVEDREVLVLRGKRDGAIKHVFWNPIRGEEVRPIDSEFKDLWRSLRVPDVVDLAADLESGKCAAHGRGSERHEGDRQCAQGAAAAGTARPQGQAEAWRRAAQVQAPKHASAGRGPQQGLCEAVVHIHDYISTGISVVHGSS